MSDKDTLFLLMVVVIVWFDFFLCPPKFPHEDDP